MRRLQLYRVACVCLACFGARSMPVCVRLPVCTLEVRVQLFWC